MLSANIMTANNRLHADIRLMILSSHCLVASCRCTNRFMMVIHTDNSSLPMDTLCPESEVLNHLLWLSPDAKTTTASKMKTEDTKLQEQSMDWTLNVLAATPRN